jgi:hypothetical protein
MSYTERLLSSGERIFRRDRQHWFIAVWGARYAVLALVVAIVLLLLRPNLAQDALDGPLGAILGWIVAALFIGGLVYLGWSTLRYLNQEYVLTTRRVIQVEGVINKRVTDSSLEKINDAVLSQSFVGRIFGFGDLDVLTAAEAGIERFRMIKDPIGFKRAMLDAKHEYERDMSRGSGPASPPLRATDDGTKVGVPVATEPPQAPGPSRAATALADAPAAAAPSGAGPSRMSADEVMRTLANLADLRDRGAISSEEYEGKKAELLGRL